MKFILLVLFLYKKDVMKKYYIVLLLLSAMYQANACTNLIVTKGASNDGSVYLVYINDGEWIPHLNITAAKDYNINDSVTLTSLSDKKYKIPQVEHTYRKSGFIMNEYQVAIGETTFTGREELWDKNQPLKYWELMKLATERAKTAREAIEVMTSLSEQYGYGSEGETFSIADPNEAWIMEMTGTGGQGGAVWVAIKIPDGTITAHANHSRIGEFPLNDPENCLYSKNVVKLAVEKGYYQLASGEPFRFNDAYDPATPQKIRYSETRVWSIFQRAAPSLNLSPDYSRGIYNIEPYPLYVKPDVKLDLPDILSLIRDHYENTGFDMTKNVAAGAFGNPNRPRPLNWELNENDYSFERTISTQQTAFTYIGQLRSFVPNDLAVMWYSFDDTYTNCFIPVYIAATELPKPYTVGNIRHYDRNSMWWAFNFVSNFAKICYKPMVRDIKKIQNELETIFILEKDSIEKEVLKLPVEERKKILTDFTVKTGEIVHKRWIELGDFLVMKYNDGYYKDDKNQIRNMSYPKWWLNKITEIEGERYIFENAYDRKAREEKK
jgi:dipeptidase